MLPGFTPFIASTAVALRPQDVFATSIYTANGSSQTINNGIDIAGQGGLVWLKRRQVVDDHYWYDTVRGLSGANGYLSSNSTAAQQAYDQISSFNSNGFTDIGWVNGTLLASWSFRRAAKFFDVVAYTGNGTAGRKLSHGLGVAPGMIFVKKISGADAWFVHHRSLGATQVMNLNATDEAGPNSQIWNDTAPDAAEFTLGFNSGVNQSGANYIAYLFAHDTAADGLVQCGSYTGNGTTPGPLVNLGWQPQWLMFKQSSSGGNDWTIVDSQRATSNPREAALFANRNSVENNGSFAALDFLSNGFRPQTSDQNTNGLGETYIYIAIREPV